MAATRAAELTEAYRILSDAGRRAAYDKTMAPAAPAGSTTTSPAGPAPSAPPASSARTETTTHDRKPESAKQAGRQFVEERASRDEFVRKATIGRFRQVFAQVAGSAYDESRVPGFDVACIPKTKLFTRAKGPRLLGRFVSRVDGAAVAAAWAEAGKLNVPSGEEVCVFLMGTSLAPSRELAEAIAQQRRRPARGGRVTLIPVDASAWDAHLPTDAPAVAKDLLARLRKGT